MVRPTQQQIQGCLLFIVIYSYHMRLQMQQTQKLVQNGGARSVTDASSGSRAALESLPPPGIRAVMHSGDGWQTTTIAFQDGTQEALVTLQELLRAPGGLDPEHPATLNLLEHLHQDVEAGGSLMGNPALRRIAQAGPRDFTEVSSAADMQATKAWTAVYMAALPIPSSDAQGVDLAQGMSVDVHVGC